MHPFGIEQQGLDPGGVLASHDLCHGIDALGRLREEEDPGIEREEAGDPEQDKGPGEEPVAETFHGGEALDRLVGSARGNPYAAPDKEEEQEKTQRAKKEVAAIGFDDVGTDVVPPHTAILHQDAGRRAPRRYGYVGGAETKRLPDFRV